MLIGYARVSTHDQTLDLQRDALEKAECEKIFTDTVTGTKARRPGLEEALSHLRACLVTGLKAATVSGSRPGLILDPAAKPHQAV